VTARPAMTDPEPSRAYEQLAAADEALGRLIDRHGRPDPFSWAALDEAAAGDPFTELVLHVVAQQISTRAALTIFGRVRDLAGGAISPPAIAAAAPEDLRAAGLSTAKARSVEDLAARVLDGRLSFARLAADDDDAARVELEAVRGIGPWSAQMYLLHQLRRPDVFPAGDVGLQRGAQSAFGLDVRPSADDLAARAERWRPLRSYAAALLWAESRTAAAAAPVAQDRPIMRWTSQRRGASLTVTPSSRGGTVATITVGRENSTAIELYYEDHGSGSPVLLLHGWPVDSRSWEPQLHPLLDAGHRVITYDRRGFGRSSRPTTGYDFDTLAADLDTVLTELDLHDLAVVGFSLGTGEMARYIGKHGTERLRRCVFIETLAPSFAKSEQNPWGVDAAMVAGVQETILADRFAWLTGLIGDFLNLDEYLGKRVSEEMVRAIWDAGADASPWGTWACPPGWLDDFGQDIRRIDVPTLIMHGTADRILPIDGQGRRMHAAMPDAEYVEIEGGPHVMCVTHAEEVNRELLAFLSQPAPVGAAA
jgi:non-heme chloroperoxidase